MGEKKLKPFELELLIKGGLIGAALGAFLSEDKEEGAVIGALLGAAFAATLEASESARKTNVPVYVAEGEKLYEVKPNGEKRFIRNIRKPSKQFPHKFKLR